MRANTLRDALCRNIKTGPLKGRGPGHATNFEILGPLYIFGTAVVTNCVFGTACISHPMTDYPYRWRGQVTRSDFTI